MRAMKNLKRHTSHRSALLAGDVWKLAKLDVDCLCVCDLKKTISLYHSFKMSQSNQTPAKQLVVQIERICY